MMAWLLSRWRNERGAVAIETAVIMAGLGITLMVGAPEVIHHTRGQSLLTRSTAAMADTLGSLGRELGTADFNAVVSLAGWGIAPLPADQLAFRVQSFVRSDGAVAQEWVRTSGTACTPGTATTADAAALMPVERKSLIVVSSCYTLASLTGISPAITLSSRIWQAARVGRVTVPDAGT
jgi:Flp pilus assembly pilin Flp